MEQTSTYLTATTPANRKTSKISWGVVACLARKRTNERMDDLQIDAPQECTLPKIPSIPSPQKETTHKKKSFSIRGTNIDIKTSHPHPTRDDCFWGPPVLHIQLLQIQAKLFFFFIRKHSRCLKFVCGTSLQIGNIRRLRRSELYAVCVWKQLQH